jgi:hypothetical protein
MEGSIFDAYSHRLAVHHSNAVAIDKSLGVFECGGVVAATNAMLAENARPAQ